MTRFQKLLRDSMILLVLIAIGVLSRYVLVDIPNFKPVAAIVMFAAFWFRSVWVAGLSLVLMMLVSNMGLDHCPWQVTMGVVSGLVVATFLGRRLARQFSNADSVSQNPLSAIAQLSGSALAMSLAFFVISNLSVWSMGQWYPMTAGGLVHCFTAAIPFFKYTLCGDMLFSGVIFATWYAVSVVAVAEPSAIRIDQAQN